MCEHGWRDKSDCDECLLQRLTPQAAARIAELEAALRSVSTQCGNVIFNGEQMPADHERHMRTWRSVKGFVDASRRVLGNRS
jgi:hypothetical protein